MVNKGILFLSVFAALLFHAGGIFWLNCSPLSFQKCAFENAVNLQGQAYDQWQRQKRTELLSEIFDQICTEAPNVKQELHELKAEYAPTLSLTFPTPIPLQLSQAEFAFRNSASYEGEPWGKAGEETLTGGTSVIAPLPPSAFIGPPPLADLNYEGDFFGSDGVIAGSEHFEIQVEYAPKRSRPGYVFKVTLLPRAEVAFKKIRQNFYFLLDRSNSMPRTRYFLNKKAVAEALAFLKEGDRFNILIFDDRVVRFHNTVVNASPETIEEARTFLESQGHGGYFAATDLYSSLGKIIPQDVAENEINTAILLSDGDTYLSQEKQRLTIGGWTELNRGKIALYTVTSGTGNNISLLELLSSFNKGVLIHAQEHANVGSRLAYLMRTIQNPIGKQMIATAATQDPSMLVMLQPKAARIPDLYQNRPFIIYGSTNKLEDFVLFLQGRFYNQRFDIKKKIVFDQASLGAHSVERSWTQLVAQEFYERYFTEGKLSHLEAAKQLLSPLNLPTPLLD